MTKCGKGHEYMPKWRKEHENMTIWGKAHKYKLEGSYIFLTQSNDLIIYAYNYTKLITVKKPLHLSLFIK